MPAELAGAARDARQQLVETVAECDDALLEKYLEEGALADDEILRGLVAGTRARAIVPLLCGSATLELGVAPLLWAATELLPSAADRGRLAAGRRDAARAASRRLPRRPFSALVFKTMIDRYTGTLSVLRVVSGTLRPDLTLHERHPGLEGAHRQADAAARGRARGRPRGRARATWWRWRSCAASTPGHCLTAEKGGRPAARDPHSAGCDFLRHPGEIKGG